MNTTIRSAELSADNIMEPCLDFIVMDDLLDVFSGHKSGCYSSQEKILAFPV